MPGVYICRATTSVFGGAETKSVDDLTESESLARGARLTKSSWMVRLYLTGPRKTPRQPLQTSHATIPLSVLYSCEGENGSSIGLILSASDPRPDA